MKKILLLSLILLLLATGCNSIHKVENFNKKANENVTIKKENISENKEKEVNITDKKKDSNSSEEAGKTEQSPKISDNNIKKKTDNLESNKTVQKNLPSQQNENKSINTQSQPVVESEKNVPTSNDDIEVNYTDKSNDLMYSITHGIGEYSTESECNSVGFKIKNNELDAVMDWNEVHPEEMKQPVIKSSMCLTVIKEGKEYWFLHFITVSGNNMDAELKELYK